MNICAAYVEGVVDALMSTKALCPPDNLAARRVIDIVMKHLRQHPEERPYVAPAKLRSHCSPLFPAKIQTEALPKLQRCFSLNFCCLVGCAPPAFNGA